MALPIIYKSPANPNVVAAKAKLKAQAEEKAARRERYLNAPVPNYIAYGWLFPNYDPRTGAGAPRPLPKCRKCECTLQPKEHHDSNLCVFTPKYVEHTPERKERWEGKREEIRESRLEEMRESRNTHYCDHCGEELLHEEHAIEHAEDCRRTVECPDCGEELEFMVEHECSVRECRRCGESLCWGTEHSCEP